MPTNNRISEAPETKNAAEPLQSGNQVPAISLPKGGAIRGIGEKFEELLLRQHSSER